MRKTARRAYAAMIAAALLLAGCTGRQVVTEQHTQVDITFSWWGNDTRTDYTLKGVSVFEQRNPDIRVNCSYSEWTGYEARSRVQMVSDTEADVMQVNFGWLSQYSPDGNGYYDIEQLSDYIDLDNFSQEALNYGRRNGILNAIPIAMNTETVYINKTIYDRFGLDLPQTWDDLFKAAEVMKKEDVYPISGASKSMWMYLLAYAEQKAGYPLLREDGKLQFKPKDFQVMLEMYKKMIDCHVIPQVEYYNKLELSKGGYAGTVAWVSDAVNYYGANVANGEEIIPVNYTHIDPRKSGQGWYAKPATLYAVSKNTEQPEEAAKLLDFLLNDAEMAVLQGVEKGIPLSRAAQAALEENDMLHGLQYDASQKMEQTAGLKMLPPVIENNTLIDSFVECCNQLLFDRAAAQTAARELWDTAKSLLEG